MKKSVLNALKIIFFFGIGIFFIWLFMHNLTDEEINDIYFSFIGANYWWIALSILLLLLSHVSRTIRWKLLIEPLGYKPSNKNLFLALLIGYFANLALPRLGEVTRCGVVSRYEKIPFQKMIGTVVTERALDLLTLIIAFVLSFLIHMDKVVQFKKLVIYKRARENFDKIENPGIYYWIMILSFVGLLLILIKYRSKISHLKLYQQIKNIILGFVEGLKSLFKIKKPFWFVFHSVFIWTAYLFMTWVVFFSLPETSHLGLDVGLAVLVFGAIGIVIIQGGIGIYPWIVAQILALFYISGTKGYAMGWLLWTGQTVMIIISGILAIILLPILNNKKYE